MNKSAYNSIYRMFDYITNNVICRDNTKKQTGGGSNDTEPYNTFHKILDNTYDYLNYVFKNRKLNSEKYDVSIKNLDEKCDCEKYKCMKDSESEVREEEPEEPVPIVLNKEPVQKEETEEEEEEEPVQKEEEEPVQKEEEPVQKEEAEEEPVQKEEAEEEPVQKEEEPFQKEEAEEESNRDLNKLLKKSDYIE